jgi:hypothetical protein
MGDVLADGTTLVDQDDNAGTVTVRGPNGRVIAYDQSHLSDADWDKLTPKESKDDGEAAQAMPSSNDIPGILRMPAAYATGAYRELTGNPNAGEGNAFGMNALRHPNIAGMGEATAAGINPLGLIYGGGRDMGALQPVVDTVLDRDPSMAKKPPVPPVQPGAPTAQQPGQAQTPPATRPMVDLPPRMQLRGHGPLAPDPSQQFGAAYDAEGKALDDKADVEGKAAVDKAHNAAQVADYQRQALAQQEQARQQVIGEYKNRMAEVDKAQAALDKQQENPDRLWNSWGTGQRLAAVVSQALGGFGQAFTGQNGSPINKMIEQDIDAQRQNYMRARDSVAAKRSAYGQLREQGLSDAEAAATLQVKQADAAGKAIDAQVDEKYAPTQVKAAAQMQKAQIAQKKQEGIAKLQQSVAETAHARAQTALERAQAQAALVKSGSAQQLPPGYVMVGGEPVFAGGEKEAEDLTQMLTSGSAARKAIAENHTAQSGAGLGTRLAQYAGVKTAAGSTGYAARDAFSANANRGLGNPNSPNEQQMAGYKEMLDTPWNPEAGLKAGQTALADMREALSAKLIARGVAPERARGLAARQYPDIVPSSLKPVE